ncbi:hypothetical protein PR048_028898 [Dryococelus australis]|uniref:Uncharacterized protein n=1 Tax=Dryococelus australis TaxID=614101 RepID=A0ABQ9GBU6_9NEOP|nr:hypothetical protein PR048_028898 [Dryococelus australis]
MVVENPIHGWENYLTSRAFPQHSQHLNGETGGRKHPVMDSASAYDASGLAPTYQQTVEDFSVEFSVTIRQRIYIDFKCAYIKATFAIGSEFIRHDLDDSTPIADLQKNKLLIPHCQKRLSLLKPLFRQLLNRYVPLEHKPGRRAFWFLCGGCERPWQPPTPSLEREEDHLAFSLYQCQELCFDYPSTATLRIWFICSPSTGSSAIPTTLTCFAISSSAPLPSFTVSNTERCGLETYTVRACESGWPSHKSSNDRKVDTWSSDGVVVRLFASYLCELVSIPGGVVSGFSHVGIVPDDAAGRLVFSGISCFTPLPLFHSGAAPYSPRFTLIVSQDLDVKSSPNFFTHFTRWRVAFPWLTSDIQLNNGEEKPMPYDTAVLTRTSYVVHINYRKCTRITASGHEFTRRQPISPSLPRRLVSLWQNRSKWPEERKKIHSEKLKEYWRKKKAEVVKWLDYSLPTEANRVRFPAGSLLGIVPVGRKVFSVISRFPCAPSFRRLSILISITLIGSQDLAAKSCPNFFTHFTLHFYRQWSNNAINMESEMGVLRGNPYHRGVRQYFYMKHPKTFPGHRSHISYVMFRQSQCSSVRQAPSLTVGFTRRFHTLSSIHNTNTSPAVIPQSPVLVHTSIRLRTLARRPPSKNAGRWSKPPDGERGCDSSKTPSSATARRAAVYYSMVSQKGRYVGQERIIPGRGEGDVGLLPRCGAADRRQL